MERKFKLTQEEMKFIQELNSKKIITGDNEEFQKFLLELRRNIVLGGESFGELNYFSYIDDEEVNISLGHNWIDLSPRPFVKNKPRFSDVIKKIIINPYLGDIIKQIVINDMIIDSNSFALINNNSLVNLEFNNCYFEDNSKVNFQHIRVLKLNYCSISSLSVFSNTNIDNLVIEKSKVRTGVDKLTKLNCASLSITDSDFYTDNLFFNLEMPKLVNLVVNRKTFNDADLILLEKVAPNLKKAKVNATLSDIDTLDNISLYKYFSVKSSYEKNSNSKLDNIFIKDIETESDFSFSLKGDMKTRKKLISIIEAGIESIFAINERDSFDSFIDSSKIIYEKLKDELITELKEFVERFGKHFDVSKLLEIVSDPYSTDYRIGKYLEYKDKSFEKVIKKERNELVKSSFIIAYEGGYRESINSIISKYFELVSSFNRKIKAAYEVELEKYKDNLLISSISVQKRNELYALAESFEVNYFDRSDLLCYRDVIFNYMPIFRPFFNNYSKIDDSIKSLFKNIAPDFPEDHFIYSPYLYFEVDNLKNIVDGLKYTKKFNYDILLALALLKNNSINNYILRHSENYEFFSKTVFSNDLVLKVGKLLKSGNLSRNEILEEVGLNNIVEKNGIVYLGESPAEKDPRIITYEQCRENRKKSVLNYYLRNGNRKYGIGTLLGGYPHLIDSYFDKYSEVYRLLNDKTGHKKTVDEIFEHNKNLNKADYAIYLDLKFKKGIYIEKTCIYWLKNMFNDGFRFDKNDYRKLKELVSEKAYDLEKTTSLYYEVIKYIHGNYPSFIVRYLSAKSEFLEQVNRPRIWTTEDIYNDESREIVINHCNSSGISNNKILRIDPKKYYKKIIDSSRNNL